MAYTVTFPITAVQDRLSLTLTQVKARIGVKGTDDDDYLTDVLAAALEAADAYMQNPFLQRDAEDDYESYLDGPVTVAIPSRVKLGVIEWVRLYRNKSDRRQTSRTTEDLSEGLKSFKDAEREIEDTYWAPYRLEWWS